VKSDVILIYTALSRRLEGRVALPCGLAKAAQPRRRQGGSGLYCVHQGPWPPILPAAQFCAPAWALKTGGKETEEDGSLPDLADGTESEGSSQDSEEEAGPEGTVEVTPVGLEVSPNWGLHCPGKGSGLPTPGGSTVRCAIFGPWPFLQLFKCSTLRMKLAYQVIRYCLKPILNFKKFQNLIT
jgi:hypothetical protein